MNYLQIYSPACLAQWKDLKASKWPSKLDCNLLYLNWQPVLVLLAWKAELISD